MKILLIAPASGNWQNIGKKHIFNGKTFRFSILSLLSVAAETPSDVEVQIVDEQIEIIPWDAKIDLVGITCMTAVAPRAYEIASRFRDRNIPVVLGGMHPSLCPKEAIQHADAIVIGDAEGIWPQVISDVLNGSLKKMYQNKKQLNSIEIKRPPRELLHRKGYATVHAAQATRGCNNKCDFCAVAAFHHQRHYQRPVEEVVKEISGIPADFFIFVDDNLTAEREYARHLFESIIPLRKKWVTQSTLSITNEPEFVQLAAEAGCIGIFAGLETFSGKNLEAVNKTCHQVEEYREAIEILHVNGIGVEAGIVFGFDGDRPNVFEQTLDLLDDLEVDLVQVSIFTPLPGTPRFEAMKDRIVDKNWAHYDFHHVVFQPKRMTAQELKAGHDWVTREFYHPWRIGRRLVRYIGRPNGLATLKYVAALNLAYYGRIQRWRINGWNPSRERKLIAPAAKSQWI